MGNLQSSIGWGPMADRKQWTDEWTTLDGKCHNLSRKQISFFGLLFNIVDYDRLDKFWRVYICRAASVAIRMRLHKNTLQ